MLRMRPSSPSAARTRATGAPGASSGTDRGRRRGGRTMIPMRPSVTRPRGPHRGELNAAGLDVSVLRTKRAAWISSFITTTQPRSRAAVEVATRTAASRLAGPSAPGWLGVRMAPVSTRGASGPQSRSSTKALSSRVSVPWVTTTPTAPAYVGRRPRAQLGEVGQGELGRWHLPEAGGRELGEPVQLGDRAHQLLRAQAGCRRPPFRRHRGDGAAGRVEGDAWARHGSDGLQEAAKGPLDRCP